MATINNGQGINIPADGGLFNGPHVDARRTGQNTGDLRAKLLRITVKAGDIAPAEENSFGGAYTVPAGNLFPVGAARTRPEIYAMGFRNPFRLTLDEDDVAYISDYSPDSQVPANFRGPAGTGRFQVVDEPANYGWPLCYQPDLPYYKWDFNTSTPLPSAAAPEVNECDNPTRGPQNTSRWVASGGPAVSPGLEYGPPIKRSEIWYSYRDNQGPPNGPLGTPCFEYYNGSWNNVLPSPCPQLFPELFTGGVGPHGTAPYDYDPSNPSPTKFPPYYDGSFIIGEFTQDTMREVKLDSQGRVFKINQALNCGPAPPLPTRPFLCDNPMDMEFGPDGNLYLLTYGDGFFNINPDAAMERFEYVKGKRAPVVVRRRDADERPGAAGGQLQRHGHRRRPGRRSQLRLGLRRQRHDRLDRGGPDAHVHDDGRLRGEADGHRLERHERLGQHDDHGRQHGADGHGQRPDRGRHVRLRRQHPVHGHGHRSGGRGDQLRGGRRDLRARPRLARPRRGDRQRLQRRPAD